jgi:hypothetical protein
MFRAGICVHCRHEPAARECASCGLWTCATCAALRCGSDHEAWTGRCRDCQSLFPAEQRRDVLEDGDGEVCCPKCGWHRRLCRLALVRPDVVATLDAAVSCNRCSRRHDPTINLVLHAPAGDQILYHLLCECGATLASTAAPTVQ